MKKLTANLDEIPSADEETGKFHPSFSFNKSSYRLKYLGLVEPYFVYEVISLYEGSNLFYSEFTLLVKRVR